MKTKDQMLLEQAYQFSLEITSTEKEIDNFLVSEGILDDVTGAVTGAASKVMTGANEMIQKGNEAINSLTQTLNVDIPTYIHDFMNWVKTLGITFLTSAGGTYILGKMIILLAKRISKKADMNYKELERQLPEETRQQIAQIESLKSTNINEYRRQVAAINKKTIESLRKQFANAGMKTDRSVISKSLDILGQSLASTPGSLIIGGLITYGMQQIGFNPMPIFPTR